MKTIFFGPWLGEFGWEYSHWHAWVNQISKEKYQHDITIASSFEGREPFYKHTTKFMAHPEEFNNSIKGKRNYIADHWINDRPSFRDFHNSKNFKYDDDYFNQIEIAENLLSYYKKNLPKDTIFIVPWKLNRIKFNGKVIKIGVENLDPISSRKKFFYKILKPLFINRVSNLYTSSEFKHKINAYLYQEGISSFPIPLEKQSFFKLKAIKKPSLVIESKIKKGYENKIISIFPRKRSDRRPDKNFGKQNYIDLVNNLKQKFPNLLIAMLGEPEGSYFSEGVPEGCLDLINIKNKDRMNDQLFILQHSLFALGSISGAMLVALGAGCPSLIWGFADAKIPTEQNNPLSTQLYYIDNMQPDISKIIDGIQKLNFI